MFGRKMEHMLVHRITQERPPLGSLAQCLGNERHAAPLRDQAADVEAPEGIEVVHHPVVTVHIGQLVDHIGQMGGKIGAGARLAQIPHDVARGDDKRGDQGPYPMPDVIALTFLRLPRGIGCVGYFRCSVCIPVFSSVQMTTRPCSKKRRAWRYKAQMWCALA